VADVLLGRDGHQDASEPSQRSLTTLAL
jgi:hypothetical protein